MRAAMPTPPRFLTVVFALGCLAPSVAACGGSVGADSDGGIANDSASATDAGSVARDSSAPDSVMTSDAHLADAIAFDAASPDAPPGSAQVRVANFLFSSPSSGLRVCLVDGKSGTSTVLEPPSLDALRYERVTVPVVVPAVEYGAIRTVAPGADCSSDGTETLLPAAIVAGKRYTLALFDASTPSGESIAPRLWPDVDASSPPELAMFRAFSAMDTDAAIDVSIDTGPSTIVFPNLYPGAVATSSSLGVPSAEGYVRGGDLMGVDLRFSGGAPIASFTSGSFGADYMTLVAVGSPTTAGAAPGVVFCFDGLYDGPLVRCSTLSAR